MVWIRAESTGSNSTRRHSPHRSKCVLVQACWHGCGSGSSAGLVLRGKARPVAQPPAGTMPTALQKAQGSWAKSGSHPRGHCWLRCPPHMPASGGQAPWALCSNPHTPLLAHAQHWHSPHPGHQEGKLGGGATPGHCNWVVGGQLPHPTPRGRLVGVPSLPLGKGNNPSARSTCVGRQPPQNDNVDSPGGEGRSIGGNGDLIPDDNKPARPTLGTRIYKMFKDTILAGPTNFATNV